MKNGISVDCELITRPSVIKKFIEAEVKAHVGSTFVKLVPIVEKFTKDLIADRIKNDSTYQAILRGNLGPELGIDGNLDLVRNMPEILANTTKVVFTPVRLSDKRASANFTITAIDSEFQVLLNNNQARFISEKGFRVDWLDWLLRYGTQIVVADYTVRVGNYIDNIANSRTGRAIMVKSQGRGFSVDPEHAGTIRNNFITRAMQKVSEEVLIFTENQFQLLWDN